MDQLIDIVVWAAIFQGFLLGLLYLFTPTYSTRSNQLLGLYLFALIMEAISVFLPVQYLYGYDLFAYFAIPEVKLFFPTLFLHFILSKTGRTATYSRILRIMYGLAFSVLIITPASVLHFLFTGKNLSEVLPGGLMEGIFMTQQTLAFLLTIPAFIIAWRATRSYGKELQEEQSDLSLLNLQWLWQFIFIMIPISLLWAIELGRILLGGKGQSPIVLVTWLLLAIFIYFVSFKVFRYRSLFERPGTPDQSHWREDLDDKEEGPGSLGEWGEKLERAMQTEKYYLQADLSLHQLSREVNLPARTISTTLNRNLGLNFSEWVNQFRVDEALRMLQAEEFRHLSIEGVGQECGFNSRSAMYAAFRKKLGQPPGNYRQESLS